MDKTFELYQLNSNLSGAIWPFVSILEVSFRNGLDEFLRGYFDEENWFPKLKIHLGRQIDSENQRIRESYSEEIARKYKSPLQSTLNQISSCERQVISKHKDKERINIRHHYKKHEGFKGKNGFEQSLYIEDRLKTFLDQNPILPNHSQLLSNMNFSFWTSFFKKESLRLFGAQQKKLFDQNKAEIKSLGGISKCLEIIRKFRNRIAHHEPIIFEEGFFEIEKVDQMYKSIIALLKGLDENIELFSRQIMRIQQQIIDIEDFLRKLPEMVQFNKETN